MILLITESSLFWMVTGATESVKQKQVVIRCGLEKHPFGRLLQLWGPQDRGPPWRGDAAGTFRADGPAPSSIHSPPGKLALLLQGPSGAQSSVPINPPTFTVLWFKAGVCNP